MLLEMEMKVKLFGIKIINTEDFLELLFRFGFNLIVVLVIAALIYYPISRRKEYLFTYLLFSTIIFLLCFLLNNVKLGLGFALGLFAVFGIIRYRTDPIPIKEMTYLFVVIGLSVINALSNKKVSYSELLLTNFAILGLAAILERVWMPRQESSKRITYEKIENIKPENHHLLMKDLRERTGLHIHRFRIGRVDFLRDTVQVRIFFKEDQRSSAVYEEPGNEYENDENN